MPAGQMALTRMPNGARLDGDGLGELVHGALGGAVDGAAPADEPGDRAGVEDDAAVALLLERMHGVLAAEEDAADVDGEEPLEVLGGVLLEASCRGAAWGCRRC